MSGLTLINIQRDESSGGSEVGEGSHIHQEVRVDIQKPLGVGSSKMYRTTSIVTASTY